MNVLDFAGVDTGTPASNPAELDSTKRFTLSIKGGTFLLPQGVDKIMVIGDRVYVRNGESGGWLFLDRETDELIRIDELIRNINGAMLTYLSVATQVNSIYAQVKRTYTGNVWAPHDIWADWGVDAPSREDSYVLNSRGDGLLVAGRKGGPLYFPTGITEDKHLVQIQGKWHAINSSENEGRVDIDDTVSDINGIYFRVDGGDWKKRNNDGEDSLVQRAVGNGSLRSNLILRVEEAL